MAELIQDPKTSDQIALEKIQNFEGKYPKQLWYLFTVEMWERFCFYGMRGVLTIFMADKIMGGLGLTKVDSSLKYAAIQAFVYAFTFIGGIFADKILGFKRSLTFGAILMILGNALIAVSPQQFFYVGITLSIIGTGFFKPNISSMVGRLYKDGDPRKEAGFSLFYSGINMGALLGGAICVWLGKDIAWRYAFLAAGVVMTIGLITFQLTKKQLGPIGDTPLKEMIPSKRKLREILVYVGALLSIPLIHIMIENTNYTDYFMYTIGPLALLYFAYQTFLLKTADEKKKMLAALFLIIASIFFFAFFEQAGASLSLLAESNLHDSLLFFHIDPNVVNNGANSLFVIILSPLFGLLWLWLSKRNKEPNTVVKFSISFVFICFALLTFYSLIKIVSPDGKSSLGVFTAAYLLMTIAELFLSPVGLSKMTSLAPKHLGGMMMGLWFLASAYGQYLAGLMGASIISSDHASLLDSLKKYCAGFYQFAIYAIIIAVVILVVSPFIKKLMREVK